MQKTQKNLWFVVLTKPAKEKLACENLIKQNFQVKMPLYKSFNFYRNKWIEKIEPMFPRYLFFKPQNPDQSVRVVHSTLGVQKLIIFGDNIASISDEDLFLIESISHVQNLASSEELIKIKNGDKVEICNGALKGLSAIISNIVGERITVLINILGREKKVLLSLEEIRPLL